MIWLEIKSKIRRLFRDTVWLIRNRKHVKFAQDAEKNLKYVFHVNLWPQYDGINITCNFKSKDEIIKMLKHMYSNGYRQTRNHSDDSDQDSDTQERTWYFGKIELKGTLSGVTCKRVQTGTREVPIFETVCEENNDIDIVDVKTDG